MNDPAQILEAMQAEWGLAEYSELAVLVSATRALAQLHKANHWRTRGSAYYGDHLLFDRLAEAVEADVDSLAERVVGLSDFTLVDPNLHALHTERFLREGMQSGVEMPPDQLINASLMAEVYYLDLLDAAAASLQQQGLLTKGTDNLLAGIADKHEGLIYLLKQRTV